MFLNQFSHRYQKRRTETFEGIMPTAGVERQDSFKSVLRD